MLKTIDIVLIAVMVCVAAWTYNVKHQAEAIEEAVNRVNRKIDLERQTISILQADWSLLVQPERLQRLVAVYDGELGLKPIRPDQFIEPDELPARTVRVGPTIEQILKGYTDDARSLAQ